MALLFRNRARTGDEAPRRRLDPPAFDTWLRNDGLTSGGRQTSIVYNGIFIDSGELPRIGYDEQVELSDRPQREDHGLEPEPRMHAQSDTTARMRPYVARDATWLDYEATVSTSADQVPLATGTRDSSWATGGRRHVHLARPIFGRVIVRALTGTSQAHLRNQDSSHDRRRSRGRRKRARKASARRSIA